MPAIWEIKRNWNTYWLWKTFVITEDMVSVSTDSTMWVAPYNESYWYTNITIDDTKWIVRMEWAVYIFVIKTSMVVASAYRNIRVRIWTNWNRKPMMSAWNSILAWSSYFTKSRTDVYVYKKTNQSWWALHLNNDTSYSAMSVAEWKTATATSSRVMRADYLKQIIDYHAWNLHDATKQDKLVSWTNIKTINWTSILWNWNITTPNTEYTAWEWITIQNNVISASWWAGNMNCLTTFWTTRRFWTKAMFNALTSKDVNGVYVILSQRDYNKMIQD